MKAHEFNAPAYWAAYLINGDDSGYDADEIVSINAWLTWVGLGSPVSCSNEPEFLIYHDARHGGIPAADCLVYTFFEREEESEMTNRTYMWCINEGHMVEIDYENCWGLIEQITGDAPQYGQGLEGTYICPNGDELNVYFWDEK